MRSIESEDSILIQKCRAGDTHAFTKLVDKHRDKAYRLAFRLTRNHDDAEDIVAEAFIRVHRGLAAFNGSSAFGTWLYRIVTNCFLDTKRNPNKPRYMSLDGFISDMGDELELQIPSNDPSPHTVAERNWEARHLSQTLEELSAPYRTIIVLYHAEMLSYEEIAQVLDMPIGTVKSRLNRARLAMRDQMLQKESLESFATVM